MYNIGCPIPEDAIGMYICIFYNSPYVTTGEKFAVTEGTDIWSI